MADIELVIKIPEGLKKDFELEQWTALSCMEMKDALMNGISLPKDQYKILQQVESYHAKAKKLKYVQKPLAWALYRVWKEVDGAESEEV